MDTFEIIYRKYNKDIYRYHMKHTNYNEEVSEELTQETFFQAYRSITKFKGHAHIKTWLIGIGKNVYKSYLKKHKVHLQVNESHLEDYHTSHMEDQFINEEMMTLAVALIETLPKKMSMVMKLRLLEEQSYNQICEDLSISMSSAKVLYYRGKVSLKEKLREDYGYEI
ncbi:RNA polymerase sigma factor [Acidaminobacter sp. JC074]|uniref:RNA polymerase sigma factor n=1 Tax=Acidaminobacter sp. JC074 TaxID=2530199 RepID=UPI001F0E7728|nr:RNA polymerase sigma factor [Acidaminobacter sp. JC074]